MLFFILAALFVLLILVTVMAWLKWRKRNSVSISGSMVLDKVERVFKLVTVEGNYSEVLQYREKNRIFFDLIPQEKKALVVVKGKVLMGMDLKKALFSSDEKKKRIRLESLPEPEILSLETDVEYFDITSSMLKRFNADNLTKLQNDAKELIRKQSEEGQLRLTAEAQAAQIVLVVQAMVEQAGWQLEVLPEAQRLLDGKA